MPIIAILDRLVFKLVSQSAVSELLIAVTCKVPFRKKKVNLGDVTCINLDSPNQGVVKKNTLLYVVK